MTKDSSIAEKVAIKMQVKNDRLSTRNDKKDYDCLSGKSLTEDQRAFFGKFKTLEKAPETFQAFQEYNAYENLAYIHPRFVQCQSLSPLDFFFIAKAVDGVSDKSSLSILDKSWKSHPQKNGFNFFQLANSLAGQKPKSILRKVWECIKEEF